MKLPQLPQDKANHFIYGLIICAIFLLLTEPFGAFFAVIFVSSAKEMYDSSYGGTKSIWDFLATLAGAVVAFLISMI
jgi:hypothetical protein